MARQNKAGGGQMSALKTDAATISEIKHRLSEVVEAEDVRVLFVIESVSRAWGFPSRDSDYDVRINCLAQEISLCSSSPPGSSMDRRRAGNRAHAFRPSIRDDQGSIMLGARNSHFTAAQDCWRRVG